MKEFIEYLAKNLVDDPNNVRVEETVEDNKITIRLHVSRNDLGKVIGKQGRTAKSIRTLLTAVAAKHNKSGHLEIDEGKPPPQNQQESKPETTGKTTGKTTGETTGETTGQSSGQSS